MPSYVGLGQRTAIGVTDTTGNNPGNWTVTFQPSDMASNLAVVEVYKIVLSGPKGSIFEWFIDVQQWDVAQRGDFNSWDPVQPLQVSAGQSMFFYWLIASTQRPAPQVTLWLRYDADLPGNQV